MMILAQLLLALAAETVSQPFAGVKHIHRHDDAPRHADMHIVQVNLDTPGLRFKLTPPSGARETTRQTTLEFLEEQKAQLAVNAHFFIPFPTQDREVFLIGLAASDGNIYSDFEKPEQSYAIVTNAPALNIDAENHAAIVTVKEGAHNAVAGSAQIITNGELSVPRYVEGQLTPGGPGNYSNERSWYEIPNARTIIGLSADRRTLTIFTVDRSPNSRGLTVTEAAQLLLRDYQVHDALNLDGGGSTTLVLEGVGIVNQPADGPRGRSVGSNLAIFAPSNN